MRVSTLLGKRVVDGSSHYLGTVIDVRLAISGDPGQDPPAPRVVGLVVSPRSRSSFLGYERSDATEPRGLAALLRWRHRGTFLAAWEDIAKVGGESVALRRGFTRYSAVLR
jgi:sporulation protein YlmC with PRC-barrel domain